MQPLKYIFMYNCFDEDEVMYTYLKSFFGSAVILKEDGSLWVSEDVYQYVFATINSRAVYSQDEYKYTVYKLIDCEEWRDRQIKKGLVMEL